MSDRQKKIIVPVDFSSNSKAAMRVGAEIASIHGSELILLHAVEPVSALAEFFMDDNINEKRHDQAVNALEKLAAEVSANGVECSVMVELGKPYKAIVSAAEEIMAEMVVMGTQGTVADGDGILGSNTNKVVRSSRCPVVTVNGESGFTAFSKILLAVDPEFGVRELRSLLYQYKDNYNPSVDVVTVISPKTEAKDRARYEGYLAKQKEMLVSHGIVDVTTSLLEGDVVSGALVQHAADHGHEMIWMETHGRSGLSSLLMSSITEEVIAYAKVPVLSLRPERPEEHHVFFHENLPI